MRCAWFALAFAILSSPVMADIVSPAPDSVRVTIYRNPHASIDSRVDYKADDSGGLAMVTETRTVDIPAGTSKLIFRGVADAIVPQTASVDGLPAIILESNFDYDLLTPGALIAKSHGERVRLVRTDRATGRSAEHDAIIRSGPEGVMLEVDGKIEALGCSDLAEKLIFERIPAGLADEPTLSMTVRAAEAGRHTIQLSYLALGLDWSATYVARLNPDGRTLNLTGWVTLINHASTTFANAPTEVLAGQLARDEKETQPPETKIIGQQSACWPIGTFWTKLQRLQAPRRAFAPMDEVDARVQESAMAITVVTGSYVRQATMSELGDYKLYTLPEPTTIAARQSKQVSFLSENNVRFERLYTFVLDDGSYGDASDDSFLPRPVAVLRLQNKKSDGLGKPLPAGAISVMEPAAAGYPVLAGERFLNDTPVGLPLDIDLGAAMDVWVEPRIVGDHTIGNDANRERHVEVEVKIGNDKPIPIVLEVYQRAGTEGFRIVSQSKSHTTKYGNPLWTYRLRSGERAVLRYAFREAG